MTCDQHTGPLHPRERWLSAFGCWSSQIQPSLEETGCFHYWIVVSFLHQGCGCKLVEKISQDHQHKCQDWSHGMFCATISSCPGNIRTQQGTLLIVSLLWKSGHFICRRVKIMSWYFSLQSSPVCWQRLVFSDKGQPPVSLVCRNSAAHFLTNACSQEKYKVLAVCQKETKTKFLIYKLLIFLELCHMRVRLSFISVYVKVLKC